MNREGKMSVCVCVCSLDYEGNKEISSSLYRPIRPVNLVVNLSRALQVDKQ